jgi:hypothetical protein
MDLSIGATGSVAGFTTHIRHKLFWFFDDVAALFTESIDVATNTILILGIILFRIKLGFDHRLVLLLASAGLQRLHRLPVEGLIPGFTLALMTVVAFLPAFKRTLG